MIVRIQQISNNVDGQLIYLIGQMQSAQYHEELDVIIEDINKRIRRYDYQLMDQIEIELKYSHLKNCVYQKQFTQIQKASMERPVVINSLRNHKNFKLTAYCQQIYYQKALQNLQELEKMSSVQRQDKWILIYRGKQHIKYLFDSQRERWIRLQKERLFKNQYNLIGQKKLFRVDCSLKVEQPISLINLQMEFNHRKKGTAFLRFKSDKSYHLNQHLNIVCSQIYESFEEEEVNQVQRYLQAHGENITKLIQEKVHKQIAKDSIKYQLQMQFTQKGLFYLRKSSIEQLKVAFSKALNAFKDITNSLHPNSTLQFMHKLGIKRVQNKHKLGIKQIQSKIQNKKQEVKRQEQTAILRGVKGEDKSDKKELKQQAATQRQQQQQQLVFIVRKK